MSDNCEIWLENAESTGATGLSLSKSLYSAPVSILLSGEIGAGKTTFTQGLLRGLGITQHVTSPTYALEQRYIIDKKNILPVKSSDLIAIHIDLYRLDEDGAEELLEQSDDEHAIRIIEWPSKLRTPLDQSIEIHLTQKDGGRILQCTFEDIAIPTDGQINAWRKDVLLPNHIINHCDAVADLAVELGKDLLSRGYIVRLSALRAAAKLHDLLRFVDFKAKNMPEDLCKNTPEQVECWGQWKSKYNMKHEAACAEFLRDNAYPEVATIVEPHGLELPHPDRTTIEQQILFYADKRMMIETKVSLEERFEDFANRYNDGSMTKQGELWLKEARKVEKELGFSS